MLRHVWCASRSKDPQSRVIAFRTPRVMDGVSLVVLVPVLPGQTEAAAFAAQAFYYERDVVRELRYACSFHASDFDDALASDWAMYTWRFLKQAFAKGYVDVTGLIDTEDCFVPDNEDGWEFNFAASHLAPGGIGFVLQHDDEEHPADWAPLWMDATLVAPEVEEV